MADTVALLSHLRENGCYSENGHFRLVSKKHSDSYVQARIGMMHPGVCKAFARALIEDLSSLRPSCLAASTMGGLLLAREVARTMGSQLLIGRQVSKMVEWVNLEELDRKSLDNVLLIEDVLTTSGTLIANLDALSKVGVTPAGIAIAVNRSGSKGETEWGGRMYEPISLINLPLRTFAPEDCLLCPAPPVDLSNPEEDFLSVVLSMPSHMADFIMKGYMEVYDLQKDYERLEKVKQWMTWLPGLIAGLPRTRVKEDSSLATFISRYLHSLEPIAARKTILTEIVGHMLIVANIRVESRSLGCTILVGDKDKLDTALPFPAPVNPPLGIRIDRLSELIPYYDALLETDFAFIFDKNGTLTDVRCLIRTVGDTTVRGLQVLSSVTNECDAVGFVLRRGKRVFTLYRQGSPQAIAELSDKTGIWEFSTPVPIVREIENRVPGVGKTLESVLEIAREMITQGYGGIFVIGTIPATLDRSLPKVRVHRQSIFGLSTRTAAEIAKLDGAVILTKDGDMEESSVILHPSGLGEQSQGSGIQFVGASTGGGRRQTALRTSTGCPDTVVVCVSQNGVVEIFVQGETWQISEAVRGVSH